MALNLSDAVQSNEKLARGQVWCRTCGATQKVKLMQMLARRVAEMLRVHYDAGLATREGRGGEAVNLKRLRAATDEVIGVVYSGGRLPPRVNWEDLHCCQASWVIADDGSEYPEVLIGEASPDADEFQSAVSAELERRGWRGVRVVTEW